MHTVYRIIIIINILYYNILRGYSLQIKSSLCRYFHSVQYLIIYYYILLNLYRGYNRVCSIMSKPFWTEKPFLPRKSHIIIISHHTQTPRAGR